MRTSIALAASGLALVIIGLAYADRSRGWTYALAVLGVAMIAGAALRRARRGPLSAPARK